MADNKIGGWQKCADIGSNANRCLNSFYTYNDPNALEDHTYPCEWSGSMCFGHASRMPVCMNDNDEDNCEYNLNLISRYLKYPSTANERYCKAYLDNKCGETENAGECGYCVGHPQSAAIGAGCSAQQANNYCVGKPTAPTAAPTAAPTSALGLSPECLNDLNIVCGEDSGLCSCLKKQENMRAILTPGHCSGNDYISYFTDNNCKPDN